MRRALPAILMLAALAIPAPAGAAAGWVPGFDELAPSGNLADSDAVVTSDLRTVAVWVAYPYVRAAVRPRGGTFGDPFALDAGEGSYVAQDPRAVALPNGDVVVAWAGAYNTDMRVRLLKADGTVSAARPTEPGGTRPALAVNASGTVALAYYQYGYPYLAIKPANSDTFAAPVLLLTPGTNEKEGALDVTLRADGQVAVAIGSTINNPSTGPGAARMLIARRFATDATGAATAVEFIDSRTLTFTQPSGTYAFATFDGEMELLSDGRQLLAYRLETDYSGSISRELRAGPRDGTSQAAPPLIADGSSPTEHNLIVDEAGRPTVWWRNGAVDLRVRQATTAGTFSASAQTLTSSAFATADIATFGAGRTGVIFNQAGAVKGSTSDAGGAFTAPVQIATATVPSSPQWAPVALAGAGDGSGVGFWPNGATVQASALQATPFDATAPTLQSLQGPDTLVVGATGEFSATGLDDWSTTIVSWLFGDGSSLAGTPVQKAFGSAGSFAATARVTDAVGNTASGSKDVAVTPAPSLTPSETPPADAPPADAPSADTRAPVLSLVKLSPSTLRLGRKSTRLTFALDEPATVTVRLKRVLPGFRVGGRCVARRPLTGVVRRCSRFVLSGTALKRAFQAGPGKLTIRRPRTKGRYRVIVVAVDAAGNRSSRVRRALTVR